MDEGGGGGGREETPMQKCPRCDSYNTKFCYYNNYSLSQPRYFCKACRRYWTLGGTLRNVPVGGSCRKTKRARTTTATTHSHVRPPFTTPFYAGSSFLPPPPGIILKSPVLPHQLQPHYFPPQPRIIPAGPWSHGATSVGELSSSSATFASNIWNINNSIVNDQTGSYFTPNQWPRSNTGFNPS